MRGLAEQYQLPYFHLDIMKEPDLASFFEVLTVPAVMIYHEGREVLRQARFLQFEGIEGILAQLPKKNDELDYSKLFR